MANTIVTDTLMYPNVTVPMGENIATGRSSLDFGKMLSDASSKTENVNSTDNATTSMKVDANADSKVDRSHENDNVKAYNGSNEDNRKAVAKDIMKKAEGIKDDIKEQLDVSDEDIEEAMTRMGLSMQDLLDPAKVKDLMMNLTDTPDSLTLLTNAGLYESMKLVLDNVNEALSELESEYGISANQLNTLLGDNCLFNEVIDELNEAPIETVTSGVEASEDTSIKVEATIDSGVVSDDSDAGVSTDVNAGNFDESLGNADEDGTNGSSDTTGSQIASEQGITDATGKTATENETKIQTSASKEAEAELEEKLTGRNEESSSRVSVRTTGEDSQNADVISTTQTTTTVNTVGDIVEQIETYTEGYSNSREIVSQVTESIRVNISPDTTSMEMQLHPASLGTVNMQVTSAGGTVTAHITVQSEAVKAALESQLMTLQQTFEEQGQKVEAVEVSVASYDLNRGMNNDAGNRQNLDRDDLTSGRTSRSRRKSLNLSELDEDDLSNLDDEERLSAEVMKQNGTTVEYLA